jgi:hypothetical protein
MRYLFLFGSLLLFSQAVNSQENSPTNSISCTLKETSTKHNDLIEYLIAQYGIEQTEQVLLALKQYQNVHKVTVMGPATYTQYIQEIDKKILMETNLDSKLLLEKEKLKVVDILQIENELTSTL